MKRRIDRIIAESRIIGFFSNFNKMLLLCFYNSKIYKSSIKLNTFFRNIILRNAAGSVIFNWAEKAVSHIKVRDLGIFIILAVVFNTSALLILKREIDMFSLIGRIFFFISGVALFTRKEGSRRGD